MKCTRLRFPEVIVALAVLVVAGPALAQHAGDLWIGRSAEGRLKLSPQGLPPADSYVYLMEVNGPLVWGWADSSPGFDRVVDPEPPNDVYPLEPGAEIWMDLVEVDPAFRILDTFLNVYEDPGDTAYLGDHTLHTHEYNWHVNSLDAAYDTDQCVWHATLFLHDAGSTVYDPSESFTVSFTNVLLREADGDFDESGTVDLGDVAAWPVCLSGPGQRPDPQDPSITLCEVECTNAFDYDEDLDVDLRDFAQFQNDYAQ